MMSIYTNISNICFGLLKTTGVILVGNVKMIH